MKNMEKNCLFQKLKISSLAVLAALTVFSAVSCSSKTVPNSDILAENSTDSENTADAEEASSETDASAEDLTEKSDKDPNKYNTYPMDELFGEKSPLLGYWHTDGRDVYIEYNDFGSEGFAIFLLGEDFQIFSSEIGIFSGSPQNVTYMLASSNDDKSIKNLYNKDTNLSLAVNDDNTISLFVDFGYGKNSTYTLEKTHPSGDDIMYYVGDWGNKDGVDISFLYEEGSDTVDMKTLFGFSSAVYPVGIPTVSNSEIWLCCPYIDGMLTTFSDDGVFYDVINVHMLLNADGTLVAEREYTNPKLRRNSMLSTSSTLRKLA